MGSRTASDKRENVLPYCNIMFSRVYDLNTNMKCTLMIRDDRFNLNLRDLVDPIRLVPMLH